jgi:hypothetical protein
LKGLVTNTSEPEARIAFFQFLFRGREDGEAVGKRLDYVLDAVGHVLAERMRQEQGGK